MKVPTLVLFNCFSTVLDHDAFMTQWDRYAENAGISRHPAVLLQHSGDTKYRFKYISKHNQDQVRKDSKPVKHFTEANIRMVEAGGYMHLQSTQRRKDDNGSVRVFAFISHNENDIQPYIDSPIYSKLHVYQAYYESCKYSHVLEFMVPAAGASELLQLLQLSRGVETGIYKECLIPAL